MSRTSLRNRVWGPLVAGGLLAGAVAGASQPAAAGGLFRWVDARGIVHFTDRPPDDRYRPVERPRGLYGVAPGAGTAAVPGRYDPLIVRAAGRYGVPAALVKAVIHAESAFDPKAVSRKGAMGLMQLMPGTAAELGVASPLRAEENVLGGTRYLRDLHRRYGSWPYTLAAYNAGPAAVDRYRGVPPYRETRAYVDRVLSYYRRYHGDFPR